YDSYRHGMLIDHFYGPVANAGGLRAGTLVEFGDFVNGRYEGSRRRDGTTTIISLRREGLVGGRQPVVVEKAISIEDSSADIQVSYRVRSADGRPMIGRFGIEMAYTLSAGTEPDRFYEIDGVRAPENDGR